MLRLSTEEFWSLTPNELFLLHDRYLLELQQTSDYHAGLICSTFANAHKKKGARSFKPKDFMPKRRKEKKKVQTWQEQLEMAKAITLAYGGSVAQSVYSAA